MNVFFNATFSYIRIIYYCMRRDFFSNETFDIDFTDKKYIPIQNNNAIFNLVLYHNIQTLEYVNMWFSLWIS